MAEKKPTAASTDPYVRAPRFRAVFSDGRVLEGTVQGSSGRLGGGALHAGQEAAERAALASLIAKVLLAETVGRRAVTMIPTGPGDRGDGEWADRVEVPLLGVAWQPLPARSSGCFPCRGTGTLADGRSCSACSPDVAGAPGAGLLAVARAVGGS